MEHLDIKKHNLIAIFNSVIKGKNTLNSIAQDVGISKMNACDLTQELIQRNLLTVETVAQGRTGRKPNLYSIVDKYHCMFFEETEKSFCCISIDINGHVIDRFDHVFIKELSKKENVKLLFQKFRKKHIFGKYCIEIFAVCNDDTALYLPKNVVRTTKESIILSSLAENDKVILFKLGKKLAISAYNCIHFPKKGIGETTINKVLNIDKTYTFCKELYDGLFLAMQRYSLSKLVELI